MKHHIIVKYADSASDKAALTAKITQFYAGWREYPFLRDCQVIPNCVDRANRYDLMIVLTLDKDSLPLWDESVMHKAWKADFGSVVGAKAIFDCE